MKMKSTKRALFASALAILMCVTMLIGTTFAWFTDSVTSANNIIKSGNLDVELEYWDGTKYSPVTSTTKLFNDAALWEPGHTEVAYLKVSNIGSLALKYQLSVNVVNEIVGKTKDNTDIRLSDYLVFSVVEKKITSSADLYTRATAIAAAGTEKGLKAYNGATKPLDPKGGANADDYVALIIYMPTTVGNDANHNGTDIPSIEMGVNLLATQLTYEKDSFDNTYDENAWHPDFVVTNSDELKVALTNGGNVALANDVIISESLPVTKDTVLDLNGKSIGTSGSTTGSPLYLQGGKLTVKNGTLDLDGSHTNVNGTFSVAIGYEAQTELVVENVNFTGKTAINGTFDKNGPLKIAISDCTMDVTNVGIAVSALSTEAIATINNCNIDADVYAIFASQGSKITINGGTYKSAGKVITSMNDNTVVTINGGTFDGELWVTGGGSLVIYGGTFTADPSAYVANGYIATTNADGTYTVVKGATVANAAELQAAINNAVPGTTIQLAPGVNYGTLVFGRNASNKVVDISAIGGDETGNERYSRYENITILGAAGATVDQITFDTGREDVNTIWNYIDVKNLTIKNVTFSGASTAVMIPDGFDIAIDGLSLVNCKMTDTEGNDRFVYQPHTGYRTVNDKTTGDYVMTHGVKNLTITGCEITGAYQVLEARPMEGITITNNVFKNSVKHDILLSGSGYDNTGITITGNTSDGAGDRFVRATSIGNGTITITGNTITNNGRVEGPIKVDGVTDGNTNVTVQTTW